MAIVTVATTPLWCQHTSDQQRTERGTHIDNNTSTGLASCNKSQLKRRQARMMATKPTAKGSPATATVAAGVAQPCTEMRGEDGGLKENGK